MLAGSVLSFWQNNYDDYDDDNDDDIVMIMTMKMILIIAYMQKTCDVAVKAILAKKKCGKSA